VCGFSVEREEEFADQGIEHPAILPQRSKGRALAGVPNLQSGRWRVVLGGVRPC
jgi:hypothetical protein